MCIRNKKYRKERTNKRHKSPGACQLNTPYCCFTFKKKTFVLRIALSCYYLINMVRGQ